MRFDLEHLVGCVCPAPSSAEQRFILLIDLGGPQLVRVPNVILPFLTFCELVRSIFDIKLIVVRALPGNPTTGDWFVLVKWGGLLMLVPGAGGYVGPRRLVWIVCIAALEIVLKVSDQS